MKRGATTADKRFMDVELALDVPEAIGWRVAHQHKPKAPVAEERYRMRRKLARRQVSIRRRTEGTDEHDDRAHAFPVVA
jgi:hypothetical protein